MKLTVQEGYRLRIGDYRVLYTIDDKNKIVVIYRIKSRSERTYS
ncbi:MAG: type II toxin-antitoxin system RelE/ParE family toxin [Candidatus Wallbacteria bacterium]|nr:type II toxin-antitoxin system RelE/ParE family toxin [Candidatus Wallbacteria bacterium]